MLAGGPRIKLGHELIRLDESGQWLKGGKPTHRNQLLVPDEKFNLADFNIRFDLSSRSQALAEAEAKLSVETVNEVQLIRLEAEIKLGGEIIRLKEDKKLFMGAATNAVVANDSVRLLTFQSAGISARARKLLPKEKIKSARTWNSS
jgi:hypothetical protein